MENSTDLKISQLSMILRFSRQQMENGTSKLEFVEFSSKLESKIKITATA